MTTSNPIQLIYAGGTFGSHGKPLAPLPADILLPNLLSQLKQKYSYHLKVLKNTCIKDSSQLNPSDLVHFYTLILNEYKNGSRQFVLITGTDTLSYLGAFLAEAFAGSNVCILLTASMKPLFDSDICQHYQIDKNSDAWGNITQAIQFASQDVTGIYTCLSDKVWLAQSVQKIDSHALLAFTGTPAASTNNLYLSDNEKSTWLTTQACFTNSIIQQAHNVNVSVIYTVPNDASFLAEQIEQALDDNKPSALIIMGFGAGNIPHSINLEKVLDTKADAGHLIVATTQCPFGGVSNDYAAGSWQYQHQVLSGGKLTVPAIYARLLWLLLTTDVTERRKKWKSQ